MKKNKTNIALIKEKKKTSNTTIDMSKTGNNTVKNKKNKNCNLKVKYSKTEINVHKKVRF